MVVQEKKRQSYAPDIEGAQQTSEFIEEALAFSILANHGQRLQKGRSPAPALLGVIGSQPKGKNNNGIKEKPHIKPKPNLNLLVNLRPSTYLRWSRLSRSGAVGSYILA
jgi:hypothetical protein